MIIQQKGRIKQLDGLRGIAILFILCFHFFNYGFLKPYFDFGWAGVDLFFVLSGFLITGILLDTKDEKGFYKTFLIRRVLRILPLYYGVLIIFSFVAPLSDVTNWFGHYQLYFWTYTSNFLFLQKGFFRPLGHFWSLAIEEQFYLVWPLVVWLTNRKQLITFSCFAIVLGIFIRLISSAQYLTFGNPLAHMDGLLFGGISAVLLRQRSYILGYMRQIFIASILLFSAYLAIYLFSYGVRQESTFYRLPLTFTLVCILFSSFLLLSLQSRSAATFLSNQMLVFFGKYSYGMYVFNSIFFHYSNWAGADRLSENNKLFVYAGVFLLTIIVSYLSYHLFEVRFLRLKEKVNLHGLS